VKYGVKGFFKSNSDEYEEQNLRSGTMLNLSPAQSNMTLNELSSIGSVPSKMSKSKSTPVYNQENVKSNQNEQNSQNPRNEHE